MQFFLAASLATKTLFVRVNVMNYNDICTKHLVKNGVATSKVTIVVSVINLKSTYTFRGTEIQKFFIKDPTILATRPCLSPPSTFELQLQTGKVKNVTAAGSSDFVIDTSIYSETGVTGFSGKLRVFNFEETQAFEIELEWNINFKIDCFIQEDLRLFLAKPIIVPQGEPTQVLNYTLRGFTPFPASVCRFTDIKIQPENPRFTIVYCQTCSEVVLTIPIDLVIPKTNYSFVLTTISQTATTPSFELEVHQPFHVPRFIIPLPIFKVSKEKVKQTFYLPPIEKIDSVR